VIRQNLAGAICAMIAAMCFSVNDVVIKFLSADYALHQIVFTRSFVAFAVLFGIIVPFTGGFAQLKTRRLGMHLIRGFCVVLANICLFLGLAALPIADVVAIYFISPLVLAVFSIIFLNETVGPRRWAAILIGLMGVLCVVKPGTSAFQIASLLPLVATVLYSLMHIIARHVGDTESAACMTFYVLCIFFVSSAGFGVFFGNGQFEGMGHASLEFLFRKWGTMSLPDLGLIVILGSTGVCGAFLISQAFRLSEAAFAAPFQYIAMPMAVMWGVLIFDTFPDLYSLIGIVLILGSGLYLIWRETKDDTRDVTT